MQGKEVDSWSRALHAFECCKAYGGDGLMSVSEYALMVGMKSTGRITQIIDAAKVANCFSALKQNLSVRAATDIATIPELDWQWFTELCIGKGWGEKERSAAIKAVKAIAIPDNLTHWLEPFRWKKDAALSAATGDERIPRDIVNWVNAAIECLEGLPSDRGNNSFTVTLPTGAN